MEGTCFLLIIFIKSFILTVLKQGRIISDLPGKVRWFKSVVMLIRIILHITLAEIVIHGMQENYQLGIVKCNLILSQKLGRLLYGISSIPNII